MNHNTNEKLNIMAVDDEKIYQLLYDNLLKKYNNVDYQILKNGKEGLEYYLQNNEKIDIIFTDITMPEMDGIEMTKKIKKYENNNNNSKNVKIYAVSSISRKDFKKEEYFFEFIQKQYLIDKLNSIITKS
ncbi:MAG: response regulator [Candidatus Woesearchaeota archaeon]